MTIWKFDLMVADRVEVSMPKGAHILVQMYSQTLIWHIHEVLCVSLTCAFGQPWPDSCGWVPCARCIAYTARTYWQPDLFSEAA